MFYKYIYNICIYIYIYEGMLGHVGGGRLRSTLNRDSYIKHTNKTMYIHMCVYGFLCKIRA